MWGGENCKYGLKQRWKQSAKQCGLPAGQTSPEKLTARGQTCLLDLGDQRQWVFYTLKFSINITWTGTKTLTSAEGTSKILQSSFLKGAKCVISDKNLPARSGRQVKKVACPGQNLSAPGRRLFPTLVWNRSARQHRQDINGKFPITYVFKN